MRKIWRVHKIFFRDVRKKGIIRQRKKKTSYRMNKLLLPNSTLRKSIGQSLLTSTSTSTPTSKLTSGVLLSAPLPKISSVDPLTSKENDVDVFQYKEAKGWKKGISHKICWPIAYVALESKDSDVYGSYTGYVANISNTGYYIKGDNTNVNPKDWFFVPLDKVCVLPKHADQLMEDLNSKNNDIEISEEDLLSIEKEYEQREIGTQVSNSTTGILESLRINIDSDYGKIPEEQYLNQAKDKFINRTLYNINNDAYGRIPESKYNELMTDGIIESYELDRKNSKKKKKQKKKKKKKSRIPRKNKNKKKKKNRRKRKRVHSEEDDDDIIELAPPSKKSKISKKKSKNIRKKRRKRTSENRPGHQLHFRLKLPIYEGKNSVKNEQQKFIESDGEYIHFVCDTHTQDAIRRNPHLTAETLYFRSGDLRTWLEKNNEQHDDYSNTTFNWPRRLGRILSNPAKSKDGVRIPNSTFKRLSGSIVNDISYSQILRVEGKRGSYDFHMEKNHSDDDDEQMVDTIYEELDVDGELDVELKEGLSVVQTPSSSTSLKISLKPPVVNTPPTIQPPVVNVPPTIQPPIVNTPPTIQTNPIDLVNPVSNSFMNDEFDDGLSLNPMDLSDLDHLPEVEDLFRDSTEDDMFNF